MTLAKDRDPSVRVGVATAVRQFVSGSLTVDSQPGRTTFQVRLPITQR